MRIQGSMCLEVFVERRLEHVLQMVPLEDHIHEVVVKEEVCDPVCVYTFIYAEIKTWTIDFDELHSCFTGISVEV